MSTRNGVILEAPVVAGALVAAAAPAALAGVALSAPATVAVVATAMPAARPPCRTVRRVGPEASVVIGLPFVFDLSMRRLAHRPTRPSP